MKKIIAFTLFLLTCLCLNVQSQQVPDTINNQWTSLFEYCLGKNGLYQKVENKKTSRIIKKVTVLSFDKKANDMYAYDDYGCYHVSLQPNWSAYIKKEYNVDKLKPEELKDELVRIENRLDSKYKTLNETLLAKKAKYEKDRKMEIERVANQLKEKREVQLANYRQLHKNWRTIPIKSVLHCRCMICEQNYEGDIIRLSGDTIFAIELKQGYFGYIYSHIHAFLLDNTDKNNVRNHLEAFHDSLTFGKFNMSDAIDINKKDMAEYKESLKKNAPIGFIHRWGWHLNSADGIEPYFTYFNTSAKTIKYVDFYFSVYNAVGDKCYLKYDKSYTGNVRGVGPVEPYNLGSWNWERATHYTSSDASEMKIVKLVITFMDGTTKTILRDSIVYDS